MNLLAEKRSRLLLILVTLLAAAFYFGAYVLYLAPLKDSLSGKESQLKSERQLSTTIEERLASAGTGITGSTAEMQATIPVEPLVDQLILDLEKAEVISNSSIISMEFSDGDSTEGDSQASGTTQTDQSDQTETSNQDVEPADETAANSSSTPAESQSDENKLIMPEGLAKTSATVIVESANYFELEKFIETLERLKRAVRVESIAFTGPEEITSLSTENPLIQMTLVLNAFHLTGMDELKDFNPKIETPQPANKRNPFPAFGNYSEDNLLESNMDEEGQ